MPKELQYKFGKIPWSQTIEFLGRMGWELEINRQDTKRFLMGPKMLSLVKVGSGKWKVEYFFNKRLVDSGGITDEEFAKVLAIEMGALRGVSS
jgi:hypothetical protein